MAIRRRWLLPILLLLLGMAGNSGCDLAATSAFLVGPETTTPALLKRVASDERNKQVSVVVLTYEGLETRPEFLRSDRDLNNLVVKHLREGFAANKEQVKLVPPSKVEEFKNSHPSWKKLDLAEIGRHFDADYVVYLEIGHLSMYETGSSNMLYHGRAELTVNLVDVKHPDETPESRDLAITHPSAAIGGTISADEMPPQIFKAALFDRIAKQVAWQFTAHKLAEDYHCD
jgi:hypothetical protein